jgi:hypothetical protein
MYKINDEGLVTNPNDGRPLAVMVDSFVSALGTEAQSETLILRLYHKDWKKEGPLIPREQVHQFALSARRAAELGRQLLELAAQAEKETGKTSH